MKNLNINLKINFEKNSPDGTPRKLLDISLAKSYGWVSKTNLNQGFKKTYKEFIAKKLYKQ